MGSYFQHPAEDDVCDFQGHIPGSVLVRYMHMDAVCGEEEILTGQPQERGLLLQTVRKPHAAGHVG